MISQELLDILVCPACKGDLAYEQDPERLICGACQLAYRVKEGIPIMLIDEAERLVDGPAEGRSSGQAPEKS